MRTHSDESKPEHPKKHFAANLLSEIQWLNKWVTVTAAFFVLAFIASEWVVNTGESQELIVINVIVIFVLLLMAVLNQVLPLRYGFLIAFITSITIGSGIIFMTLFSGDKHSLFFSGLIVLLLTMGMYIPWQWYLTLLSSALITIFYLITFYFYQQLTNDIFIHTIYLGIISIFTAFISYVNYVKRLKDYKKNRLADSYLELQKVDQMKSDFISSISHELRTPLTMILTPVENLLENKNALAGTTANLLQSVRKNSVRLLKLVNNILDISQLESKQKILKPSFVDINRLVSFYIETAHQAAESLGVTIHFSPGNIPDKIWLDVKKIETIFNNLLSNAMKFIKPGDSINIATRFSDKHTLEIEFTDTGPGIPENMKENIFNRFSRLEKEHTTAGSGIGLALARDLARFHGGDLVYESVSAKGVDNGSTFRLTIPVDKEILSRIPGVQFDQRPYILDKSRINKPHLAELAMADLDPLHDVPYEFHEETGDDREKILIVEDNTELLTFIQRLLSKKYTVETATNGEEAWVKIKDYRYDLIITDVMMPKMDGYELTKLIKSNDVTRNTPVMILSAKSELDSRLTGLEQGADDYLAKPFNSQELMARMRALLKLTEYQRLVSRRNREIEEELETARLLQSRLLPDPEFHEHGIKVQGYYLSMDAVGGDFYDIKKTDDHLYLLIVDVSGHGVPGALLATITQMSFENLVKQNLTPHQIIEQMNDVFLKRTVKDFFATAFCARVNLDTYELSYASAGHHAALLYRSQEKTIEHLKTPGVPIGFFETTKSQTQTTRLNSKDRLLIYTDGVTETPRQDSNELFGEQRLEDFFMKNKGLKLTFFCEQLVFSLRKFSGNTAFEDDVTLLIAEID